MVSEKLDHWKLSSVSPCQYPNAPARNKALARLRRGRRGWQHPAPCRPTVPTGVTRSASCRWLATTAPLSNCWGDPRTASGGLQFIQPPVQPPQRLILSAAADAWQAASPLSTRSRTKKLSPLDGPSPPLGQFTSSVSLPQQALLFLPAVLFRSFSKLLSSSGRIPPMVLLLPDVPGWASSPLSLPASLAPSPKS